MFSSPQAFLRLIRIQISRTCTYAFAPFQRFLEHPEAQPGPLVKNEGHLLGEPTHRRPELAPQQPE